jgi:signal transduction histidine kinase
MRLRTRLVLASAWVALVPLVVVMPLALEQLRRVHAMDLAARMDAGEASAKALLEQLGQSSARAVEELSGSTALEAVAERIHRGEPPSALRDAALRLTKGSALSVLSLLDDQGRTHSSAHLQARIGAVDDALFAVTRAPGTVQLVQVELLDGAKLSKVPSLVSARPMEYGGLKLWVVGGVRLDTELPKSVAALTRTRAVLTGDEGLLGQAGEVAPPTVVRRLTLAPRVQLALAFSQAADLQVERGVRRSFFFLAALGLLAALCLGLWLSPRITRPVEALTAAAEQVAAGAWGERVEQKATGEVGALVDAFNKMTTDLKRTTEQLLATERVAAWQEVARRLAHEIKNPLTPIRMSLETLLAASRSKSPEFERLFQESAGPVLEEVDRLRRIVDEFSRFARLPAPKLETLKLDELAAHVAALHGKDEALQLETRFEPNVAVRADRDQLTQVVLNLVKNAAEAMKGEGRVRLAVSTKGSDAVLEVEDEGPGVRPEDRARIFEPYFTTKEGGTGLGLAIAARICLDHGGRLELGETKGRGSLFRLVLPKA